MSALKKELEEVLSLREEQDLAGYERFCGFCVELEMAAPIHPIQAL